ncbi:hypothetical protein CL614_07130 [archaeon]|nr:hypothetical protein [archaeon]
MEKKKLTSFIDKYHLAGNTESVKVECKDNTLNCNFIASDQNVVGKVSMNGFNVKDCELGIYATSQLVKLLTALDSNVEIAVNSTGGTTYSINLSDTNKTECIFMLADMSVIQQVPQMKQLPDFNVKIKLTSDFTEKFVKSKNALPDAENFAVRDDALGTDIILNYSSLNTNRITFDVSSESTADNELSPICFSANLFKEILLANKDATEGYLEVSQAGLARVTFIGPDYLSNYFLVQLQSA